MNYRLVVMALGLVATAGCGHKAASTASANIIQGAPASAEAERDVLRNKPMARARRTTIIVQTHGMVTAVDEAAGTLTLDHGRIPEARWRAGITRFKALPAIASQAMVGEDMDFTLRIMGTTGEVTVIQTRP